MSDTKIDALLYAQDAGANNVINSVQEGLEHHGKKVARIHTETGSEPGPEDVQDADVYYLGLSQDRPEARFAEKVLQVRSDARIVFCEDYPKTACSAYADQMRTVAPQSTACVIDPVQNPEQAPVQFQHIHVVGGPNHWQEDLEAMQKGAAMKARGEITIQERGGTGETRPLGDASIVYIEGSLTPATELKIFLLLSDLQHKGIPVIVHHRGHPRTPTIQDVQRETREGKLGAEALRQMEQLATDQAALLEALDGCWEIAGPDELVQSSSMLRGAADLVIADPGATGNIQHPQPLEDGSPINRVLTCKESIIGVHKQSGFVYEDSMQQHTYCADTFSQLRSLTERLLDRSSQESLALSAKMTPLAYQGAYSRRVLELMHQ